MTTDRTTKALLLAIALGLWANMAGDWLKPAVVVAQDETRQRDAMALLEAQRQSRDLAETVRRIESDLDGIFNGLCLNRRLC